MSTLVLAVIGALVLVAAVALSVLGSFAYLAAAAVGMFFVAAALIFNAARSPAARVPAFLAFVGVVLSLAGTVTTIPFLLLGVGLIATAGAIVLLLAGPVWLDAEVITPPSGAGRDHDPAASSYIEQNTRERERLRGLVERLSDDELRRPVSEHWTVAGVLGHIAFWDARALVLVDKLERGVPFSPSDVEPEDVTWINDATRPLIHVMAPREAAQLALRLAEETDRRVASLNPALMWPLDPTSPLNPLRAAHRAEHLDEIEPAVGA